MSFGRVQIRATGQQRAQPPSLKRLFDVVLVLLTLPVTLPVILAVGGLLAIQGAPVLFAQTRVGQGGRLFRLWKFRTMRSDAMATLDAHLRQDANAAFEWALTRKLRFDPRITPLGRFLRRTSLDELPQLWNVLRGEMSLVGPRPVPRDELIDEYSTHRWAYLACRPGLTGLWQVSGRNSLTYAERVKLDIAYATRRSARRDLAILWRTIGVVLRGTGC